MNQDTSAVESPDSLETQQAPDTGVESPQGPEPHPELRKVAIAAGTRAQVANVLSLDPMDQPLPDESIEGVERKMITVHFGLFNDLLKVPMNVTMQEGHVHDVLHDINLEHVQMPQETLTRYLQPLMDANVHLSYEGAAGGSGGYIRIDALSLNRALRQGALSMHRKFPDTDTEYVIEVHARPQAETVPSTA